MLRHRIKRAFRTLGVITTSCGIVGFAIPLGAAPAPTAPAAQDVNGSPGVVAEIVQCNRDSGVLSIRMRLRNTGGEDAKLLLISRNNYDNYYVVAGDKKYLVLRDKEGTPLATQRNVSDGYGGAVEVTIPKGGSYVWYAKYPAPPVDVKKIDYYTPLTVPFERIPITD